MKHVSEVLEQIHIEPGEARIQISYLQNMVKNRNRTILHLRRHMDTLDSRLIHLKGENAELRNEIAELISRFK